MFLPEFGLAVHPFGISPRLDFLYKSGAFEESIAHLVYGLDNSEAIIMITGAIGTGKTMAIQSFLSYLGDRYISALVTNTSVDAKELLKLVLEDLGVPLEPGSDKSDLLIAFKKFLIAAGREGKRIIIVIDEAQNLSREVLEEVRLLTNLGQGDEQPVQIILSGQPELEAALQRQDLAQLRQRIRVHYKLAPLSRRELEEYVDHRMTVAGGAAGVFSAAALDRLYALSGGVPRVVNTLCGDALLSAFVAGRRKVDPVDFDEHASGAGAVPPAVAPPPAAISPPPVRPHPAHPMPEPDSAVASAPIVERESVVPPPLQAPPRPKPQMATRQKRAGTGGQGGESPQRRPAAGRVVAAVALVAVVAVAALAATGRLEPLWRRVTGGSMGMSGPGHSTEMAARPLAEQALPPVGTADRTAAAEPGLQAVVADSAASPATSETSVADVKSAETLDAAPAPATPDPTALAQARPKPAASVSEPAAHLEAASAEPTVEPTSGVPFFLHVSSFRTSEHAGSLARQYTEGGLPATVRQQVVREVTWHRVYLGPFSSHDEAVARANALRDAGTITYYKVMQLDTGAGQ